MEKAKNFIWLGWLILILTACQLMEPDARPILPATAVSTPTTSAEAAATAFTTQQQNQTPAVATIPVSFATATSAALSTSVPDQPIWPDITAFPPEFEYQFDYLPTATWERYVADNQTFIAWRMQSAEFASETAVATLIQDAGQGIDDFAVSDPVPTSIGDRDWLWIDFEYTAVSGEPIQGFITIQNDGQTETVVWAEAPKTSYGQLLEYLFIESMTPGQ